MSGEDVTHAEVINTKRIFDGYHRNTGRKTTMKTFRIFAEDAKNLSENFAGNSSVVVRAVLEMFFKGELPQVTERIKQIIGS